MKTREEWVIWLECGTGGFSKQRIAKRLFDLEQRAEKAEADFADLSKSLNAEDKYIVALEKVAEAARDYFFGRPSPTPNVTRLGDALAELDALEKAGK